MRPARSPVVARNRIESLEAASMPVERGLTIVGLGEALFDVFVSHDRQVLGGAPLNVAVHAHKMVAGLGGQGIPASRIGRDALGRRMIDELTLRGIPTTGLQIDGDRPTGRVNVTLRGAEPNYEIVADAAWDHLELTDDWIRLADACAAVCFGTLAQRSPQSRATMAGFLEHASQALRLFDVNLRQAFFSADLLWHSCSLATIVKLNEHELPQVRRLLVPTAGDETQDEQANALRRHFQLDAVVLTRGAAGTALYTAEGKVEGQSARYARAEGADSVGAGDACAAGILIGMLLGWPAPRIVSLANDAGAYVAAQPGATPSLPLELVRGITPM
jgi:fructokinase